MAFGLLGAAMAAVGFFVSPWARRMVASRTPGQNFAIIGAVVLTGLVGVALHLRYWGLVFAFPLGAAMTLTGFAVSSYLNELVDSPHRATVLSFKGFAFNLAYGGLSLLFALALHFLPGSSANAVIATAFTLLPPWFLLLWIVLLIAFWRHRHLLGKRPA